MSNIKQRKTRKLRGNKTGRGSHKKGRGGGSRGGRGNAGLHKYRWSYVTTYDKAHFKKPSMKPKPHVLKVINLSQINDIVSKKNLKEIVLDDYKVLSSGSLKTPVKIRAHSFSKEALSKIKSIGGTAEPTLKEKVVAEKNAGIPKNSA